MIDKDEVEAPAVWSGQVFWFDYDDEGDDEDYEYEHHVDCNCDDCFDFYYWGSL